jgi:hypothetical protein
MRSGEDDEWDEYEDDDDEEERGRGSLRLNKPNMDALINPSSSPSEPPQIEEPPEEAPEEDTSWMADHRVDDDGTEWGQDSEGTWYYRDPGSADWEEWTD